MSSVDLEQKLEEYIIIESPFKLTSRILSPNTQSVNMRYFIYPHRTSPIEIVALAFPRRVIRIYSLNDVGILAMEYENTPLHNSVLNYSLLSHISIDPNEKSHNLSLETTALKGVNMLSHLFGGENRGNRSIIAKTQFSKPYIEITAQELKSPPIYTLKADHPVKHGVEAPQVSTHHKSNQPPTT